MKQRQTILFLTRLYHPHIGGVEKHVYFLSQMLIKKGYKVVVVTEQFDSHLSLTDTHDGIEIFRIPVGSNSSLKKFLIWRWVLAHQDLFLKAQIIHIHDVFFWILPLRLFLPKGKIFTTFHGYEGYPIKKKWIFVRKITEYLSSGTICIGDFMRKWYNAQPTYVSYGGVRIREKNIPKNNQSAIFFGRLESQTGILEYISAYKALKKKFPKFKLTVVGDGPLRNRLPKDVIYMNFEPNVEELLEQHRFVFVSRYLSMLEAMIQRKEVVAVYSDPVKKDYLTMSPFSKYVTVAKNSEDIVRFIDLSIKNGPNTSAIEAEYQWAKKNTWEEVLLVYLRLWGIIK